MENETRYSTLTSTQRVAVFYEGKTREILKRYGPGPRVHYHAGFINELPHAGGSTEELRGCLVAGQERMLRYAAQAWQLHSLPLEEVLDVGCGLGGPAIFLAEEFGARVTAITVVRSHVELVRNFAAQAAVGARVLPLLCDALAVPGANRFDAAIAIDSSNSFARRPWFLVLARLLRQRGRVFVFDCFVERSEYTEPLNRHWCTQIGTIDEYLAAAREARFTIGTIEDVSLRAMHFWTTTLELMHAEAREKRLSAEEAMRREASLRAHALVHRGLAEQGLRYLLMSFTKSE